VIAPSFPATDPEKVQAIVRFCHFDLDRVAELLAEDRALALASWDWGFGDWESALGAASHMGRRDIAQLLIEHGARSDLFTWAMMDAVDVVRAACEASPGIQRIPGPHGITLLGHARAGKAERVEAFLRELGGADEREPVLELSAEEAGAYLGEYAVEGGGAVFVVEESSMGGIGILRKGGSQRKLHRTGEHVFKPAGAPHVTVSFVGNEERIDGLTIDRGQRLVTAQRVSD
jgi:hypothetical protein